MDCSHIASYPYTDQYGDDGEWWEDESWDQWEEPPSKTEDDEEEPDLSTITHHIDDVDHHPSTERSSISAIWQRVRIRNEIAHMSTKIKTSI